MTSQKNLTEKKQQQPSAEERKLLSSQNDVQIIKNQSEQDLSKLDQSIDIGQSVEQVHNNENGYQEIIGSETSLYNPEQNLKLKQKEKLPLLTRLQNAFKRFFCKRDCQQSEINYTDNQLIASIFLRSAAAYYFYKQRKLFLQRRNKSINDEKILRNIDSNLSKNGFIYYDHSSSGQKTLLKGSFISKQYPLNTQIEIKGYKPGNEKQGLLSSSETRKIELISNQYEADAVPIPLQSQQNLFTSAVAGFTYFISSNIYQIKLKSDSLSNFTDAFYFFGYKNRASQIIKVDKVFKNISWLKIKSDQKALKICAFFAGSLALFFFYKTIKSSVTLVKRKKGFFSRTLHEIKEYFQL